MTKDKKKLLPLTSDLVFHAVYGRDTEESKQALIALLNAILDRKKDPITDIVYLNPISYSSDTAGKTPVLDIKVLTGSQELIDVELQVSVRPLYRNRPIFYGARMIADDLEKGEDYAKMKKTIVISIMSERLFAETEDCHTVFSFLEETKGFKLTDIISLHYLELCKIDVTKPISEMTEAERLGAYIRCASEEGCEEYVRELLKEGEGAIQMADTILRKVSEDDLIRERILAEKKRQYDINSVNTLIAQAREEGLQEGQEEGRRQGFCELARKMCARGMGKEEIAELLGTTVEEVQCFLGQE